MSKRKLIADARIVQHGVHLKSGDEVVDVTDEDAADLIVGGFAHWQETIVDAVVDRVRRTYNRRDLTAQ